MIKRSIRKLGAAAVTRALQAKREPINDIVEIPCGEYASKHGLDISAAAVKRAIAKRRAMWRRETPRVFPGIYSAARVLGQQSAGIRFYAEQRARAEARNEALILAQEPTSTEFTREYARRFESLNNLTHCAIAFPAPCDFGDDDDDDIRPDGYSAEDHFHVMHRG